jgi:hypothetical protein
MTAGMSLEISFVLSFPLLPYCCSTKGYPLFSIQWDGIRRRGLVYIFMFSGIWTCPINTWILCNFYEALEKDSAYYVNGIVGGSFLHKSLAKGREILDSIIEYTTFKVKPKPLQEEHKSSHEDLLAAESDPSPSTPSDSAIEPSPEPGTSKGEEILSPKSPSQFEDDPYRTIETPRISFMPN